MRAIQDFCEYRLNFQRYNASSELYDRHLLERECFRTKRFVRGRMDLGIDFEDELFFAVRPLLYRIISECKNQSHHNFGYIETSTGQRSVDHVNRGVRREWPNLKRD